ncbi:MAG TPA: sulfite exporter TauE/SafE family protein [Solirubrobacterales bacterium]|nr:sulfite exporter TauE/SafE family protein [Solirubrobacterales bacterium]
MERERLIKLAVIGLLAGAFSALFGVGGGTVIVPLLIFWLAYGERQATATSLSAIVIIGALAAAGHGLYGNVDVGNALLVAVPAVLGVALGVALQQRIPERLVSLMFAALLVGVAVELIVP